MSSRSDRPFVDAPAGPLAAVERAACSFASRRRWDAPVLMRLGMNGVFLSGDVVIRVGRPTAPGAAAIELARWLAAAGVRVPAPHSEPELHDGWTVTAWERAVPSYGPVDWTEVGRMVRKVHGLPIDHVPAGYPVPSPAAFPWWDFDLLLTELSTAIDPDAFAGLVAAIDRYRSWRGIVAVAPQLCHGDVHPGNVVMTASGPVLLDWDLLCAAPPAWDHAMLITLAERWGGDPDVYEAFAEGYGHDFRSDPTARMFAELRNVAATLMRVKSALVNPSAQSEAARRLRYWRGDTDAPPWRAQ